MNKSQKGFAHLEVLLILIVISLISFVGWFVWHAKSQADKSLDSASSANFGKISKTKSDTTAYPLFALPGSGETGAWKVFIPANKKFSLRIPDGWQLFYNTDPDLSFLTALGGIDYKPGEPAKVVSSNGGRGGPFTFELTFSSKESPALRGNLNSSFTTDSGLQGKKYIYKPTENAPEDVQPGDTEYLYYFSKNNEYILITTDIFSPYGDNSSLVEKVVKTLQIN